MRRAPRGLPGLCALASALVCASCWLQAAEGPGGFAAVTVRADGRHLRTSVPADATIGDALRAINVAVGPCDRVKPRVGTRVHDGLCIAVFRVRVQDSVEQVTVPYVVEIREDRSLPSGRVRLEDGSWCDGLVRRTTRTYFLDDGTTERFIVSEEALRPMKPKVIVVGCKGGSPSRASALPGREIEFEVTAYAPNAPDGSSTGRTSLGLPAGRGVVAVDPSVVPYGTRMWIEGYGWAVAGDTGGAIKGRKIDLCFDDYGYAARFGTRTVTVRFFE